MQNKKGFTLFELIASFVIIGFIIYFMTSVVLNIRDTRYKHTADFEMQSFIGQISLEIEKDVNEKGISGITTCGTNCVTIDFGTYTKELDISDDLLTITYDDLPYKLPTDTFIDNGNIVEEITCEGTSCIYNFEIPIKHYEIDKTYKLKYIFQYDSGELSLTDNKFEVEFIYSEWSETYPTGEDGIESKTQYRSRTADKYASFDGTNDYMYGDITPIVEEVGTFEVRISTTRNDSHEPIFSQRAYTTKNWHSRAIYFADNVYKGYTRDDPAYAWIAVSDTTTYTSAETVSITLVQDSLDLKIYINGTLEDETTITGYMTTYMDDYMLGRYTDSTTYYYKGNIYEFRIWDIALTPTEISNYNNNGVTGSESGLVAYYKFDEGSGTSALDSSTNSNTLTVSGCGWGVVNGEYSGWQDEEITSNSELEVENRTLYRYTIE